MNKSISNCCGASIIDETDLCSYCIEHCEVINYLDDVSPINGFKIGAWVVDKSADGKPIKAYKDMISQNFKLWQPRKNEFCVFWDDDFSGCSEYYVVSRYSDTERGMHIDLDNVAWNNVAPLRYIDELK